MNLLALLAQIIEALNDLIQATNDPLQQAQLTKLRDAFDAMSDQAVHQLFDTASPEFATATAALQTAIQNATTAGNQINQVSSAISSAITAANAVDKLIGFLAHLP